MVKIKNTEILGLNGLSLCYKLLVYNSITSGLGIPTKDNINVIISKLDLSKLLDNQVDPSTNKLVFEIPDGNFDVLLYFTINEELEQNVCIGYSILSKAIGTTDKYRLKTIHLEINFDDEDVKLNHDVLDLFGNIVETSYRNLNSFLKKDELVNEEKDLVFSNYVGNNRKILLSNKLIDKGKLYSLGLKKEIKLSSNFISSEYPHSQIGYYCGDIVIYLWNDNGEYTIFSLIKTFGELSGDLSNNIPICYTNDSSRFSSPDKINIYSISEGTIDYFAGRYICILINGVRKLYDLIRNEYIQKVVEDDKIIYYKYSINEGIPTIIKLTEFPAEYNKDLVTVLGESDPSQVVIDIDQFKKIYPNWREEGRLCGIFGLILQDISELEDDFVVDRMDPLNKIYYTMSGQYNVLANSAEILGNYNKIVRKVGDWIVFYNSDKDCYYYSCLDKVIKAVEDDGEAMAINDKVLVLKRNLEYSIYDKPGFYITPLAYKKFGKESDEASWGKSYEILENNTCDFSNTISPELIVSSFFGKFKRSIFPKTIDFQKFAIIGAIGGVIYYRIDNNIYYL